jgi:miniconductance mechanosensitive channel
MSLYQQPSGTDLRSGLFAMTQNATATQALEN